MAISSAAAVIDVRVNNLRELNKLETGTRRIQDLFNSLQQRRNIFDQSVGSKGTREASRNLRSLIKGFAEAKAGAREFRVEVEKTTKEGVVKSDKRVRMYSKTLAGLGSQLQAVDKILANSTVGQEDFNNALTVSNKLQRELVKNQLAAAGVEAKAGAGSAQGLIALGKEIPNSVNALELYQAELNDLRRTVDRTSQDFFELGKEIERVDILLGRGPRQGQGQRPRGQGGRAGKGEGRFGNILQGAILGGGFPLLFGGPSFSAVGGLLGGGLGGSIGSSGKFGFAGGIAGSVIGGIFDGIINAALELGKALENPTKNLKALTDALPIAGTATKGLIGQLEDVGLNSVAASLALSALDDELESLGLSDEEIKKFSKQTQEFNNAFKSLKIAASALASQGLINFMTLLTKLANVFRENKDGVVQGIRAVGGLLIGEDQALGEKIGMGSSPEVAAGPLARTASPVKPVQTQEEIRAQEILQNFRDRQVKFATDAAKIEGVRLQLIRGRLAEANAIVAIDKAQLALDKAQLNFDTESNGALKEALGVKRDIAQAELNQARFARENARILRQQADAAYELERRTVVQAESMKDLNASISAQQAIRATSPFQNEKFLTDTFFGGSRKLNAEQNLRFTETLRVMNAELANVNENIRLGAHLDDTAKTALQEKRIELENNIARYKEYQPAIDEAALAQARFNEALAIAVPVTDSLFNGLTEVVSGTKTAEQAFADFLRSISSMLADAAKQMIATYIAIGVARMFAGMGGGGGNAINTNSLNEIQRYSGVGANTDVSGLIPRANGGSVGTGQSYLVGERGPELFVPRSSGTIVPNDAMGGSTSVVVNVDAKGSAAQGNDAQAGQLGRAIGAAVQAELIKQKRPGGLLTR